MKLLLVGDFVPLVEEEEEEEEEEEGVVNSAKVSVQTTRENPKPLVKKSHVFLRLFEESKTCFKRAVDMYLSKNSVFVFSEELFNDRGKESAQIDKSTKR